MAYVVLACIVVAFDRGSAVAYAVIALMMMAYKVMAYVVMAYILWVIYINYCESSRRLVRVST